MEIVKEQLEICTSKRMEVLDITSQLKEIIKKIKIKSGIAFILTPHTTAAITINENDSKFLREYNFQNGLFEDMIKTFSNLIPPEADYWHDRIHQITRTQSNASAHLISTLIGRSAIVEIENNELCLGKWGSILFIELDGPKKRNIKVIICGSNKKTM